MTVSVTPDLVTVAQELRRFPIVFVHAGRLFNPEEIVEGLLRELATQGRPVAVHDVREPVPTGSHGDHILVGFEALANSQNRCEQLAQLRASAMVQLDEGNRLFALSRVPKTRLIGCPGSQLILDARTRFLTPLDDAAATASFVAAKVEGKQATFGVKASSGLPALLTAFLAAHVASHGDAKLARAQVQQSTRTLLMAALRELGPEATTVLHRVLERGDSELGKDLDPLIVEALRGAGFVAVDQAGGHMRLLVPTRMRTIYLEAALTVIDATVEPPPAVTPIFAGLWEIERRIRRRIQKSAIDHAAGNWRNVVVSTNELRDKVLFRVAQDRATVITDIRHVANPLEWMTLDELLQLIDDEAAWACPPETPAAFFRRMRVDLQPVRNRAAHFRLPELRDAEVVERWRSELRRRFGVMEEAG